MRFITLLLLFTLFACTLCFGQATDATLVGVITDQSGAGVPNTAVEIQNAATGVKQSTKSNDNGEYRFNNVPVGRYELTATAPGFTSAKLREVAVLLNQTATANLVLQVGAVATTVEVAEAAATLDTSTAQIQSNYSEEQSRYLPMTGVGVAGTNLGVLNLSLLSAGVSSGGGMGVGTGPAVGGQRPRNNNFTIEGVDNNDKVLTGSVVYVSNEATETFTLLQNQFTAEFGHSSGGQFNVGVKSGTNHIHGSIYEYFQNRNLNAQDQTLVNQGVFSNPRFDQNRLGATVGGPIIRNKWFYFGNFEYQPLGRASSPQSPISAPTAQGYSILAGIPGLSQANLGILKQFVPAAATADQPPVTVGGVPVPVGTIPIVAPNFTNQYQWLISSDYNVSERDQVKFRYVNNRIDAIDNQAQLPVFYVNRPIRLHLASLSEYHNFSASVTNELRLGFNRKSDNIVVPNFTYPGLDVFPNITIDELGTLDIGPHDEAPQYTIFNTYQLVDNLSWTKGAHSFKFGFDGRKLIAPQQFTQRSRGDYHYSSLDLWLRDISPDVQAERSLGAPTYYGDQVATYFFAQDTWKLRPNLSLNLGVRYEYTTVPFGERSQKLNSISDVPGLVTFREPRAQKDAWAPRVGIAWSPGASGTTSVRAGFGMAYDVLFDNIGTLALPPQFSTTVDTDPAAAIPGYLARGGIVPNFQGGAALTPVEARALTANYIPDQRLPQSIQWNFGVQHVFRKDYTVEARYLGSRGVHLITQNQINKIPRVSPTRNIPTFLAQPSAGQLAALPVTLGDLTSVSNNAWLPYGFEQTITSYQPRGNSSYNGLALQLNKRFSRGLQFVGAYTWSHMISDSDAEFFSTVLSPRRPQDFNNWRAERADSAFDRRHRFTLSTVWETPWFRKSHSWLARNVAGNFVLTGTYTAESPEYATVQTNYDANLNGDAVDRAILNTGGVKGTGSGIVAYDRQGQQVAINNPATVAYVATNPNAQYILAGPGAYSTLGKNTLPTRGINNFDISVVKRFNITESKSFEISAAALNALNHPQFVPGAINNVYPQDTHSQTGRNFLIPGFRIFNDFSQAYSNNPRNLVLAARILF
jgi:hypothetical protein